MNSLYAALWGLGGSAVAEALQIYLSMRVPGDARSFRSPWSNRKQRKYFWGAVALRLFLGILPPAAITASSHVFSPMHAMVTGMTAPLLISRLAQTQTTVPADDLAGGQPRMYEGRAAATRDNADLPRPPAPRAAAEQRIVPDRGANGRTGPSPVPTAESHQPSADSAPTQEAAGSSASHHSGGTTAPPSQEPLNGKPANASPPDPIEAGDPSAEEQQEDDSESVHRQ